MTDTTIARVRVWGIAPAVTPPFRFAGHESLARFAYTVVRIDLEGGASGWAGIDCKVGDRPPAPVVEAFAPFLDELVGRDVARRTDITEAFLARRDAPVPDPESLLDIAMWDAAARQAGLALPAMLGGHRTTIPAHASSPVFDTVQAYLDYCERLVRAGYTGVKFHTMCEPAFELELARAVTDRFAGRLRFMVDLEQSYGFDDAVRLGTALAAMPCDWLEAPLPDTELEAYAALNAAVGVDVIPAGNTIVEIDDMARALDMGAWSRLRCDPCNCGGIGRAARAMDMAHARGFTTELQSYGYPLSQAANLVLMLGRPHCSWFEQPVPVEHFAYGAFNPIAIDGAGLVTLTGPGLGLEIDAARIEADAFAAIDSAAP